MGRVILGRELAKRSDPVLFVLGIGLSDNPELPNTFMVIATLLWRMSFCCTSIGAPVWELQAWVKLPAFTPGRRMNTFT